MMFQCFWCRQSFPIDKKTKDHLVPKSCGGGGKQSNNLRDSCGNCNNERGRLPDHHANYKFIVEKLKKWRSNHPEAKTMFRWLQRIINRYNNRSESVKKLLVKWEALETERLGWSPSAEIPYVWTIKPTLESPCVVQSTPEPSTHSQLVMSG